MLMIHMSGWATNLQGCLSGGEDYEDTLEQLVGQTTGAHHFFHPTIDQLLKMLCIDPGSDHRSRYCRCNQHYTSSSLPQPLDYCNLAFRDRTSLNPKQQGGQLLCHGQCMLPMMFMKWRFSRCKSQTWTRKLPILPFIWWVMYKITSLIASNLITRERMMLVLDQLCLSFQVRHKFNEKQIALYCRPQKSAPEVRTIMTIVGTVS